MKFVSSFLFKSLALIGGWAFLFSPVLLAQNTSNVFSADVRPGSQAAEWRFAYDPDGDRYATRLHYQYGFNEALRMRLIFTGSGADGRALELRYVRWETQWQFLEDQDHGWDSALRFEVQVAEGDNLPSRLRLAWSSKWDLSQTLQYRFVLLGGRQVGAQSDSGILLETRMRLAYALSKSTKLSFDLYSDLNSVDDVGSFDEQEHQFGPLFQWDLGSGFDLNLGVLFGISEAAHDTQYRVHFIYGF